MSDHNDLEKIVIAWYRARVFHFENDNEKSRNELSMVTRILAEKAAELIAEKVQIAEKVLDKKKKNR